MRLLKILKIVYSIQTVLFLIIVAVFITSLGFGNGIVSDKYFWFYFLMGLITFLSFCIIIIKRTEIQFTIIDVLIIIFAFAIILHQSDEVTTKHILFILIVILFYYLRVAFQDNKHIKYLLTVCFIMTVLVESILGLIQLSGFIQSIYSLFRITGSFFNPGPYSCYLAVIFPMAFYYTLKYRICYKVRFHFRNFPVYLLWSISMLTVVFSVIILPLAMSRTAWIACIGGCGLVLLFVFAKNKKVKIFVIQNCKKCILAAIITVLLFIAGGFGMYKLKKDSADGRTFIWKNTIELIKQNPLGVGIGNFSGSYGHVQAAYFESGKGTENEKRVAGNPEYAFNEYLQICAEQGVIVFMLFMCIVGYSLYVGIKRKKIAATSSFIALLIVASASYPFSLLPFLIALVFLLALIHSDEKSIAIQKSVSVSLAFVGLVIVSLCLYNRYPIYYAYKKWDKVKMLYVYGNNKEAAKGYDEIYPLLSGQVQFLFEYAQCLIKSEQYEESNKVLEKAIKISCDPMLYNIMGKNYQAMKLYVEAERCFMKSSNIVPNRIYPYYLMTLMYVDAGETEKAKTMAEVVLTKEPKVQSTAVREMRNEVKNLLE